MSDFCVFDTITNKNKFVSTMEYCHKILNIERFKLCVFNFMTTKYDIFYDNIMNGYSMSNCFNKELHEKYINENGDNYFKIWDKTKDKIGNIQISTHIIPGFIRQYCIDKESNVFLIDAMNIIDRFIGLLFELERGKTAQNNFLSVQDAKDVVINGITNMTKMGHREILMYLSMCPCDLIDEQDAVNTMDLMQDNVILKWKKVNRKLFYNDGVCFLSTQ